MIVHRYGVDPVTGKPGHYKVDLGPAKVAHTRGASITPRGAKYGGSAYGRKVVHGGAA